MLRLDLCAEAIRLGRLATKLTVPQPPAEGTALLALMLLHDARRGARLDEAGNLVVLEDQERGVIGEDAVGLSGFCDDHEAGGLTVEAVD